MSDTAHSDEYRREPKHRTPPRVEHFRADIEMLDRAGTVLPAALERMRDARLGYPRSSMGGTGGNSSSSPVERALGLDGDDGHMASDPGRIALATFDRLANELHYVALAILHLTERWEPRQPSVKAKAETEAANVPECAHHRSTIGTHEPLHVQSDVTGNLDQPIALCRWCYDFLRGRGRLPSRLELERHAKGQRVMVPAE